MKAYLNISAVLFTAFASLFLYCGCNGRGEEPTIERVRAQAAGVLRKDPAQIEMNTPLLAQGADDLDIVEIVLALEKEFNVTIPDSVISGADGTVTTLTIRRLAAAISRQKGAGK